MTAPTAPTATVGIACEACKRVFHVSRLCTGATGSCPWCGQEMQIPGKAIHPSWEAWHSAYLPVRLYKLCLAIVLLNSILLYRQLYTALGRGGGWAVWSVFAWGVVMLMALTMIPRIFVTLVYSRYSGRSAFDDSSKSAFDDRERFSRAGGDDISLWIPVLGYYVLFAAYASPLKGFQCDPLRLVRGPWMFALLSVLLNTGVCVLIASILFRARFRAKSGAERPSLR